MSAGEVARLGVPEIVDADRKLQMISQDRLLRVEYERRQMAHHDAVSRQRDAMHQGLVEGRKEGRKEGRATAIAEMLLKLLASRQLPVTAEHRARVHECQDPEQLQRWFDHALSATSVSEIFD